MTPAVLEAKAPVTPLHFYNRILHSIQYLKHQAEAMSSSKRLTSLEGLSSAATKIDNEHNLCVNKYHHVSSDGVLFTVSADTLRHL